MSDESKGRAWIPERARRFSDSDSAHPRRDSGYEHAGSPAATVQSRLGEASRVLDRGCGHDFRVENRLGLAGIFRGSEEARGTL